MSTYPSEFVNQVYILAYGIKGLSDHIIPEVYDKHEAYKIDKTKMKMLIPLDVNNKSILNVGNLSNDGLLQIIGKVFRIGIQNIFLIEDNFEARFHKIHIQWIKIHTTSGNKGSPDVLMLNFGNNRKYRYPNQLEFFYSHDFEGYYTYFPSHDPRWTMNAIIEYMIIPKPIDIESIESSNETIPDNKPEASLNSNDINR